MKKLAFKLEPREHIMVCPEWWTNGKILASHDVECDVVKPIKGIVKSEGLSLRIDNYQKGAAWHKEAFPDIDFILNPDKNKRKLDLVWLDYIIESRVRGCITRMRPCIVDNDTCYFQARFVDPVRSLPRYLRWEFLDYDIYDLRPLRRRNGMAYATYEDGTFVAATMPIQQDSIFPAPEE